MSDRLNRMYIHFLLYDFMIFVILSNRRIGFLDILERSSKDPHDEISVEDQALFDGF